MAPFEPSTASIHLPTNLTNLSSHRHRPPLLSNRKEGWTEVWGAKENCNDGNSDDGCVTVIPDGCDYIGGVDPTVEDRNNGDAALLRLTQHRTAWLEQIVLRMCRVPHLVCNSQIYWIYVMDNLVLQKRRRDRGARHYRG